MGKRILRSLGLFASLAWVAALAFSWNLGNQYDDSILGLAAFIYSIAPFVAVLGCVGIGLALGLILSMGSWVWTGRWDRAWEWAVEQWSNAYPHPGYTAQDHLAYLRARLEESSRTHGPTQTCDPAES